LATSTLSVNKKLSTTQLGVLSNTD
jgi:hypothetical protein